MNTDESNNKGNIICGRCAYDANPRGATHCQKCGTPLVIASVPNSDPSPASDSTLLVGGISVVATVLFFAIGGYFFWQQVRVASTPSNLNNSADNISSDIRLYNSMKEVPKVPEGTFNYGGAVVFAPLRNSLHKAINQVYPKFGLRFTEPKYNNPGQNTGITMLLDGELSFAQSSKPLEDTHYSKAKERGFSLQQVAIGIDGFLLFTHPDVSIPGLAVEQVKDIFKGKITNWNQVGGPDLAITAFAFNPKFGSSLNILLGPELDQLSPKVQFMRDYTDGVRKVSSIRGAIGIGSTGAILGQKSIGPLAIAHGNSKSYVPPFTDDGKQVNATALRDGTYPLTRRLFIVIRRDGTIDEAAGVAYTNLLLSQEGQQYIEKAGFVPIRN
ncbi:MAG: substrate-binding domain-containing protein [Brasilonema octagenarum HA4186-MV1]|nr:substrate-binding domain-containing protein [Brasilonema octagenarum HA4186-MV1]